MKSTSIRKNVSIVMFGIFLILSISNCGTAPPRPDNIIAPTPIMNNEGKYLSPYTQDGVLTEWVSKAINEELGKDVIQHIDKDKVVAPTPRMDNEGKYMSPYTQDGVLTEWVDKAINAKIGATIGKHIGTLSSLFIQEDEDSEGASLMGRFLGGSSGEKKGREFAIKASGGWEYIKSKSDMSFESIDDMAVYLYVKQSSHEHYKEGFGATVEIYPELKKKYITSIKWAYIKSMSDMSFESMDDMAVYLYAKHSGHEHYKDGLNAAMEIYPKLKEKYSTAIKKAKTK